MHPSRIVRLAAIVVACGYLAFASSQAASSRGKRGRPNPLSDELATGRGPHNAVTANAAGSNADEKSSVRPGGSGVSSPVHSTRDVHISFLAPSRAVGASPPDLSIEIYDIVGRRVSNVPATSMKAGQGLITVTWAGEEESWNAIRPGVYQVRALAPSIGFQSERRLVVR